MTAPQQRRPPRPVTEVESVERALEDARSLAAHDLAGVATRDQAIARAKAQLKLL